MSDLVNKDDVNTLLDEYKGSDDFYEELNVQVAELVATAADEAESRDTEVVNSDDLIDVSDELNDS
ncbi:DUF1931 domain-containing protein [Halorubrum ezzemoulense]|uniref:DUF1931 domain-containing protein n=1 Tax=Halorubrum ezzemoulense TaxID=337243 RepID=UPI002330AC13|nr:DUF1931 domain-containing protein [Halorubrum ezzemoulense]MDB9234922.1 DUF1931 domain-containing protein [Halorubrum ezzemoulense]MDB9254175.1 DUF1931 domain-containing protein [Halorubrum ezzemoulense]MDB9257311.1 DUF1931 domain-containing protein [Halorubrum ezzemoulense]MDB9277325.1 DUF1931 domain-containing protein [Halorubrum ezzemoulense]